MDAEFGDARGFMKDLVKSLRGTLAFDVDLGARTWFRAGGRAEKLFEPADEDDLAFFLKNCDVKESLLVMGSGSNMLVRDGGVRGTVIILGAAFAGVEINDERVKAGCAASARLVAHRAAERGLVGFEFLRGIPGSIGGCVAMNAGAYESETKDVFVEVAALDRGGDEHILSHQDMAFGYRRSIAESSDQQYIFTEAVFAGQQGDRAEIKMRMDQIVAERQVSQPPGARTGGSTFKNPPNQKAWQLIEQAGCRGLSQGDVYVCEKHCNFLVNGGRAKASDIEELGEDIRRRVAERSGILLEWEIRRVGEF